ncbi:hypothetical protein CK203_101809 [Vitis vinifera]|uniref:Uncharacterized protein n=1 Tax=Vitis vinifera TaxID=29760 RepID=A0A438FFW8_VITVI|nr:hypothetical protein CK203_101809 [Vitis vinifera]
MTWLWSLDQDWRETLRGSDQYSQIGQPSIRRDMDLQGLMGTKLASTTSGEHPHDSTIPPLPPSSIPYSKTTWFLGSHHHQFNQLHRLGHCFAWQTKTTPHLLWHIHSCDIACEFHMSDIEIYTRIGCSRIHLQLYNAIMCEHRLDEAL